MVIARTARRANAVRPEAKLCRTEDLTNRLTDELELIGVRVPDKLGVAQRLTVTFRVRPLFQTRDEVVFAIVERAHGALV